MRRIPKVERIFALYDSDIFYATRFMEYFKTKKEFGFDITVFTRIESLEEFLHTHLIEILLVNENLADLKHSLEKINHIYRLTEEKGYEKSDGLPQVFKYQAVHAIISEILIDYAEKENDAQIVFNANSIQIMSIFSPVQNAEAISFAWSLSTLISEQKKVLLVMMDLLPVPLISSTNYAKDSLTEFIYYLKENMNIIKKMKTLLGYIGNLSYLTGISHGFDILSLNKEDVRRWITELRTHTDYQTVIFYLGCYNESMHELMNLSDTVLVTTTGRPYDNALQKEWEQQMNRMCIPKSPDKYRKIQLQEEINLGQAPITLQELSHYSTWAVAKQYLNH
jgi:hypothetical protein